MRERLRRFRNASPDSDSVAPDPIAATVFSVISYAWKISPCMSKLLLLGFWLLGVSNSCSRKLLHFYAQVHTLGKSSLACISRIHYYLLKIGFLLGVCLLWGGSWDLHPVLLLRYEPVSQPTLIWNPSLKFDFWDGKLTRIHSSQWKAQWLMSLFPPQGWSYIYPCIPSSIHSKKNVYWAPKMWLLRWLSW